MEIKLREPSETLELLLLLELINYTYNMHLKQSIVVDLDYAVTRDNSSNGQVALHINLDDHLRLNRSLIALNPIINITLPLTVFPNKNDYLGFEYELSTIHREDSNLQYKFPVIVRIQLFDTLIL